MAKRPRRPRRGMLPPETTTDRVLRAMELQREESRRLAEGWLDALVKLEHEVEHYTQLFHEAPVGYLTLDRAGVIGEINQAAALLLGSRPDRVRGKPFLSFVLRPDVRLFVKHLRLCAKGGATTDLRLRNALTGSQPVRLVTRQMTSGRGAADYLTIVDDITDQRYKQQALRESEQRHREIVQTAAEGICIVNQRNEIVFANRRMALMLGTTVEDLVGRSAYRLLPPDDVPAAERAFQQRDGGAGAQTDERLCRVDGTVVPVAVSTTVIRDEQGAFTGMLRMYTDATVRTELAQTREMLVRELVAAQERERQRIARELHDQTGQHIVALSLGLGRLSMLAADLPEAAGVIRHLRDVADVLGRDIHRLALELRPAALDHLGLAVALSNYAESLAQHSPTLEIDVHCDAIDDLNLSATVQTGIYRIAQEALTNVLKHANAKCVSVILERHPQTIQLIVEDDGVGFAALDQKQPSMLGLSGMKERAALLGGAVTIESAPGKGTTVYARIPITSVGRNENEQTASLATRR